MPMIDIADKIFAAAFGTLIVLSHVYPKLKADISLSVRGSMRAVRYLFSPCHVLRPVGPQAFPDLDMRFYDITRNWLFSKHFVFMEDLENITIWLATRSVRTFFRVMRSADGETTATMFHAKWTRFALLYPFIGLLPRTIKCIVLETEFSDGTFLCTTNAKELIPTHGFDQIRRVSVPSNVSLEDLLQNHRENIRQYVAGHPGVAALRLTSLGSILVSQERLRALKNLEDSLQVDKETNKKKRESLGKELEKLRELIPTG